MNQSQGDLFFEKLYNYCSDFKNEFHLINNERKFLLENLSQYISQKQKNNEPTQLVVICTHNSRRSHIGQIWLAAAATFYGVKNVHTYSGGTEATAFNPRAVSALQRVGFEIITKELESENPTYFASFGFSQTPIKMFSKKYDHIENPKDDFACIMVCSDANENCPFIPGTEGNFSLTFDDPKAFDGTDLETEKYDERVKQIGREIFYVMSQVELMNNE